MESRPKESSSEATPSLIERIEATWQRARDHKVIQWSLGYFGVAFVLAQVEQIIAQTYDWPSVVVRVFITILIVMLLVALTVAWYQGYRGLKRFESAEIMMRPIRRDVRFMSLAARLGLVDYWIRIKNGPTSVQSRVFLTTAMLRPRQRLPPWPHP